MNGNMLTGSKLGGLTSLLLPSKMTEEEIFKSFNKYIYDKLSWAVQGKDPY